MDLATKTLQWGTRLTNGSRDDPTRPPSPPLYAPFYTVSGMMLASWSFPAFITPNLLTLLWILLTTSAGVALAYGNRGTALLCVIVSVLLDCMDGDLARSRLCPSSSGSLLERIGHWWSNMSLVAGAGIGVYLNDRHTTGVILLAILCTTQAIYLAVVTDLERLTLVGLPPTREMKWLHLVLKLNYFLMPIELPFIAVLLIRGLRRDTLWGASVFFSVSALVLFVSEFYVLRSRDRVATDVDRKGFPHAAVQEANRVFESRPNTDWYAPMSPRMPREALRIIGSQPTHVAGPYFLDICCQVHRDLQHVFRTGGAIYLSPSAGVGMAAVANKLLKPGATAIVITSGPMARRWNDVLRSLPCDIVDITVPFGEDLDLSLIEETAALRNVQALFGAASEPSHGIRYDIEALGDALRQRGVRLAVDCTGTLAIDEFKLDAWGVDYAIADSCAGLMTPGAGTFIASSTALADDQLVFPSGSGTMLDELFELSECTFEIDWLSPNALEALFTSLKMILASGLDVFLSHKEEVARSVRKGCLDVLHLDLAASRPSSGSTTALLPPGVSGHELLEITKAKYHVGIPIQTVLDGREILCIGHSGWVFRDDVYRVIEALALGLEHLRMAATEQKKLTAA